MSVPELLANGFVANQSRAKPDGAGAEAATDTGDCTARIGEPTSISAGSGAVYVSLWYSPENPPNRISMPASKDKEQRLRGAGRRVAEVLVGKLQWPNTRSNAARREARIITGGQRWANVSANNAQATYNQN